MNIRLFFSSLLTLLIAVGHAAQPAPEAIIPQEKTPFAPLAMNIKTWQKGGLAPFAVPSDPNEKRELIKAINDYMALPAEQVLAHPSAEDFPGAAPRNSAHVTRVITFSSAKNRWQSTGLYANPGEIVTVTPLTALPSSVTVEIRIGCHTDRLFNDTITSWKRFPAISRSFPLTPRPTPVANAFGGPIFAIIKHASGPGISLRFENAIEAPFFVLGKTTAAEWKSRRNAPAPWSEFVGHNMILHFPSNQIRALDDPAPLLEWWDRVVDTEDQLVGWPVRTEQERVVPDRQIGGGYMHSGYPFMCHLVSSPMITDLAKLRAKGDWGFFHELGHNHQSSMWTFPGQGEVTVNFFSLYCMDRIVGKPCGNGHANLEGQKLFQCLDRRFASPPSSDPFDQLSAFIVLLRKYGWTPLQQTLVSYQTSPVAPNSSLETRQAEFVRRYSRNAKTDLTAYFKQMGYACPVELSKELGGLPAFDYAAWRKEQAAPGSP